MDRALITEKLIAAFAQPTATPCTWRDDRDVYVAEMQAGLLASLIDPVRVVACAGPVSQQYFGADGLAHPYIAIARSDDTWLLYSEATGHFAKAFGEAPHDLELLGFSSTDVLAEWLG